RLLKTPASLVGEAVRQVYFQKAAELHNRGLNLYVLFRTTVLRLLAATMPFVIVIVVFGPDMFVLLFGEQWRLAGEYAQLLVPWLAVMFANVPAVMTVPVLGLQRFLLLFDAILFALRVGAISTGTAAQSPKLAIGLFAAVGIVANLYLIG